MSLGQSLPEFSDRERQLLKLAAQGYTDTAIAHQLEISEATVNTYWGRIRIKRGPYSRTELVARVLREESEQAIAALRAENEKLVAALQAGVLEKTPLMEFLNASPEASLAVTRERTIYGANELCETLFGYGPRELDGLSLQVLIPERYHDSHSRHVESYYEHPEKRRMGEHLATVAKRKDNSEFAIAARLCPVHLGPDILTFCSIRQVL